MADHYKTGDEVIAVVEGFEQCTTSKEDFSHRSHLAVATFYVLTSGPEAAFEKMCAGLLRFIAHHGVDPAKYNEPLTRAWIQAVQKVVDDAPAGSSVVAITNAVIERLASQRITV